jgi:hypothetical protein
MLAQFDVGVFQDTLALSGCAVKFQDVAASRHIEGENEKWFINKTLTFSIHMHTAPLTQHSPRFRVSQHAHTAQPPHYACTTAPRLEAVGGETREQ